MPELEKQWNIIHSESIIEILNVIATNKNMNLEKFFSLAWLHDIGKIKSEKNHAEISLEMLKEEFELDEIDKDCILNHGSSSEPKTKEGEIFRYADGLSLFTNESIKFRFYAEAKEGLDFEQIKEKLKKI